MSQTLLTPQQLKLNNYAVVAGDLNIALAAGDTVNGDAYAATGQEILLVQNTDGSAAHTFTITSVVDSLGRLDTSLTAYSVPLSGIVAIQMKVLQGWAQPGGQVFLTFSSNLLKVSVLRYTP